MDTMEQRLDAIEAHTKALGMALQLICDLLPQAERDTIAAMAEQVEEQGQAHAVSDAQLTMIAKTLRALVRTEPSGT